jgi:hypothetical protein
LLAGVWSLDLGSLGWFLCGNGHSVTARFRERSDKVANISTTTRPVGVSAPHTFTFAAVVNALLNLLMFNMLYHVDARCAVETLRSWTENCTEDAYVLRYGKARMTPSNTNNAVALAGNARRNEGKKPLQYPLYPDSRYTALAASRQLRKRLWPSPSPPPNGSVMMRCLTRSQG